MSMEIEYLRNLNSSYMVIGQLAKGEIWEQQMLCNNPLSGVIAPEYMSENGKDQLWYNITGKQALDVILEGKELDGALLRQLCETICLAAQQLETLMLETSDLLLLPECIFIDNQTGNISLCYFKGKNETLLDAFHGLLEFVLAKLDHRDKWAVEVAYKLYEQTKNGEGCMVDIKKALQFSCEREETLTTISYEKEIVQKEILQEKEVSHHGILKNCLKTNRFARRWLPKNEWLKNLLEKKAFSKDHKELFFPKKGTAVEPFVFEPEEEVEQKTTHPTVLLSELRITKEEKNKEQGIFRYEGEQGRGDLVVGKTPYIIGSDSACDGVIESAAVSRRHAKITQKEDVYFIEDLNSSNGTFVGGELLNCRVKMSLQQNETVVFADEKFRFI